MATFTITCDCCEVLGKFSLYQAKDPHQISTPLDRYGYFGNTVFTFKDNNTKEELLKM